MKQKLAKASAAKPAVPETGDRYRAFVYKTGLFEKIWSGKQNVAELCAQRSISVHTQLNLTG